MRGYCAIGVTGCKTAVNVGTLWRSANIFGAAFIFTVGQRYREQHSDTMKTPRHVPLFEFDALGDLLAHLPKGSRLVGVELDEAAAPLGSYVHPDRACYLLGAEDSGLSVGALDRCHDLVRLPGDCSLNVAVAGSIVLYDRSLAIKGVA